MRYSGKTVVVTGAGGFIGSHLCEALVHQGATVRAFLHYRSLGRGWLEISYMKNEFKYFAGDLGDRDSLKDVMRGADIVFHLGALISVPHSYTCPESYLRTNALGTLNVILAAPEARIVHTSTSEVYGTAQTVPISESHPRVAQSPYAASKIAADAIVEAGRRYANLNAITLRPFNTYGPRQSTRAVIPTIILQALKGDIIQLGSITPRRDFLFVEDSVRAYLLAGLSDVREEINIGTGTDIAIGRLVELIGGNLGKTLTVQNVENRQRPPHSEVFRLQADNQRAKLLLGWEPAHLPPSGIGLTLIWFQEHQNLYKSTGYAV